MQPQRKDRRGLEALDCAGRDASSVCSGRGPCPRPGGSCSFASVCGSPCPPATVSLTPTCPSDLRPLRPSWPPGYLVSPLSTLHNCSFSGFLKRSRYVPLICFFPYIRSYFITLRTKHPPSQSHVPAAVLWCTALSTPVSFRRWPSRTRVLK